MDKNRQLGTYGDGIMTLGEVASYLRVSEKTVLRMIRNSGIPCAKVAGQWRFIRTVIDDWLLSKMRGMPHNDLGKMVKRDYDSVPLSRLIRPAFIILDLKPGMKQEVIEQLAQPFIAQRIVSDKNDFIKRLLGREKMVSTAVGRGIAIPHVRSPGDNRPGGPLLCIGICPEGTDFEALDGKATRLFFLVYTDSEVVHLRVMAKLTAILRENDVVKNIINSKSADEIVALLLQQEQRNLMLSGKRL
jgi:PTS system nitrogen regulatory IIA component